MRPSLIVIALIVALLAVAVIIAFWWVVNNDPDEVDAAVRTSHAMLDPTVARLIAARV